MVHTLNPYKTVVSHLNTKIHVAPPNETDTGTLNQDVVTVETNYSKFLQIIAIGVNLWNLIYSYINFVTVPQMGFFDALITLYGCHTWSNKVNFSCGKEKLIPLCSFCCRAD